MQVNDLLEYRDKIIKSFKDGTFMSKHLKKSDAAAHDYVLKNVNRFIQEIRSVEKKLLSLFEEFFESPSPADYAKTLINIKNTGEKKRNCRRDRKQNIRFKRQNKKKE